MRGCYSLVSFSAGCGNSCAKTSLLQVLMFACMNQVNGIVFFSVTAHAESRLVPGQLSAFSSWKEV